MNSRKIFQIILISLVVLFAARILMKIVNSRLQEERPRSGQNSKTMSGTKENQPFSAYSKISERNLFQGGTDSAPEEEKSDENQDHPLTDLKLTLKGTVVGSQERSFAIIEDSKMRTQNLYHLDDSITSGVTLSSIHTDRVVINRNGNKELLLMFQEDPPGGRQERRGPPAPPSPTPRTIQRQEIQEAAGDLKTLMRDVRIIPHFTAGKRDGFTVTYVRQGSRLEELGLEKNDIVREINGTAAEEFRNIFEIFNKHAGDNSLELGVERDNQFINITYTIE